MSSVSMVAAALSLGLSLLSAGCSETACFEWTEAEGVCPAQSEAIAFFQEPTCKTSEISSIESDGVFDQGACCYAVTKNEDDYYGCDFFPGSVGVSAVSVVSSGGIGGGIGGGGPMAATSSGIGGAGGSSTCVRCGEAISGGDSSNLCETSVSLYESFNKCVCSGACSMVCAESCESMMSMSVECQDCMGDTVSGCGNELSDCANDV